MPIKTFANTVIDTIKTAPLTTTVATGTTVISDDYKPVIATVVLFVVEKLLNFFFNKNKKSYG